MGVLTYQISGLEKLKDAKLILANHPSLIDIVFLISFVPNASCVVKEKLLRNPFMWGAVKAAGYIVNNEHADEVIANATAVFNKGYSLIIFPEGTRTTPNHAVKLKRGAANIAVRTGVDITPVIIDCTPTALTKEDSWYSIPDKCVHFQIKVNDKIDISQYLGGDAPSKAARKLTKDLSSYFNKETILHE
jgi:1-acyl-sn-glycerol-3-phosphate acyltransferase